MKIFIFLALFFPGIHSTIPFLSCDIEMNTGSEGDFSPIYTEKSSLFYNIVQRPIEPYVQREKRLMNILNYQHVHMACPGPDNGRDNVGPTSEYICGLKDIFKQMATKPLVKEKKCTKRPVPIHATRDPDGCPSTIKYAIGFQFWVDRVKKEVWVDKLSRCSNVNDTDSFYMENTVDGKLLLEEDYKEDMKQKLGLREWKVLSSYHAGNPWWQTHEYFMDTYFLSEKAEWVGQELLPRPLAAELDFQLPPFRLATYHLLNLVLQWKSIYYGNWLYVENLIRTYAATSEPKKSLKVYTGRSGRLKLTPSVPNQFEIETGYSLAEFLWKLVYDPLEEKCVVYVFVNFPKEVKTSANFENCESPSKGVVDPGNYQKGRFYICTYHQSVNYIKFLPKRVTCTDKLDLNV